MPAPSLMPGVPSPPEVPAPTRRVLFSERQPLASWWATPARSCRMWQLLVRTLCTRRTRSLGDVRLESLFKSTVHLFQMPISTTRTSGSLASVSNTLTPPLSVCALSLRGCLSPERGNHSPSRMSSGTSCTLGSASASVASSSRARGRTPRARGRTGPSSP